jgi:hypothetical protein
MMSKVDKSAQDDLQRQVQAYAARVEALIDVANKENLLTEAEQAKLRQSANISVTTSGPTFQRIILYIDDLDRCPPQKVIDVLQAVHLLLTFPLFVVVVAVDARWVSRSLETHYVNLLGRDGSAAETQGATARDYLEKIFQVPYWVRAMTAQGSRDLLMSLVAPSIETPAFNERVASASVAGAAPAAPGGTNKSTDQGAITLPDHPQEPFPGDSSPSASADPGTTARIAARALELTDGEQAFMKFLAPCVGSTPRRALRFVNVYRVIKASLGAEDLHKLEKDGGYRCLMTQLAIATGSPTLLKHWSDVLKDVSDDETLEHIESKLKGATWFTASLDGPHLHGALVAFWSDRQGAGADDKASNVSETQETVDRVLKNGVSGLRHYADIAKRYSFGA